MKWTGTDNVSGINRFDIYVSENGQPFAAWLLGTKALKDTFTGTVGSTYDFYSIATDNAGNIERQKIIGDASTTVSLSPLPVLFVNFNAILYKDEIRINWSTATEINSKEFKVQRSVDGRNFETISIIPAKGNSTVINSYGYDDYEAIKKLSGKKVYYRILQLDKDAKATLTDVRMIRIPLVGKTVYLSYNPVRSDAIINYLATENENVTIQVIDETGRIVLRKDYLVNTGTNQLQIKTQALARGIYEVELFSSKGWQHVRMMKE